MSTMRWTLPLAVLMLQGCSALQSKAAPEQLYLLQPAMPAAAAAADAAPTLRVLLPTMAPGLDTERLAVVHPDARLDYYAGSRWPADLSAVLQPLFVDALRAGGKFRAVVGADAPFNADYLLRVEVRQFAIEYDAAGTPQAHVLLNTMLARSNDRSAVRNLVIEQRSPASANRMGAVIAALNEALGAALAELTRQSTP